MHISHSEQREQLFSITYSNCIHTYFLIVFSDSPFHSKLFPKCLLVLHFNFKCLLILEIDFSCSTKRLAVLIVLKYNQVVAQQEKSLLNIFNLLSKTCWGSVRKSSENSEKEKSVYLKQLCCTIYLIVIGTIIEKNMQRTTTMILGY